MLNMFAAMAQFEREMMLERQREGIAKAKAEGKYKGRKPTARLKADDAVRLYRDRKRVACIAKELVSVGAACTGPLTRRACRLLDNAARAARQSLPGGGPMSTVPMDRSSRPYLSIIAP